MACVLDCSVALAWAFPDETSEAAERLLTDRTSSRPLWVPGLWWYELSNALTVAWRRRRISESDCLRLIELYGELSIHTDTALDADSVRRWHRLAKDHGLSAYDAAYLELAERRELPLATLDRRLRTAARSAGIALVT